MLTFNNIILLGISYRIVIYVVLCFFPFYHNAFGNLSPLAYQEFADLDFYLRFSQGEIFTFSNFFENYKRIFLLDFSQVDSRYPGPLFPLLLSITFYKQNFTIILSIIIFLFEIIAYLTWSLKKYSKYNIFALLVFSLMPIPLWYGYKHSTDVVFYLLFTLLYFELINKCRNKYISIFYLLLACLRPNSTLIFISIIFYIFISKKYKKILGSTIFFLIISIIYYSPYFVYEMNKIETFDINSKVFEIKEIFNFIFNYFQRVFYLIGFIPSNSGNNLFYLLRCFCGIIFFIGLINILFKRDNKLDLVFVCFFIFGTASVFFPAYRYIIPITPILILYFSNFLSKKFIN